MILNITKTKIPLITKVFYSSSPKIPINIAEKTISAHNQPTNGVVYDKKPFKFTMQAGKRYSWCLCGRSKTQPFCDGTHRNAQLKIEQKPVTVVVEETKEYWLCNCKQTKHRPFCDGTHKLKEVLDATSIIRQ
ncbi:unnamed protein product [Phyllotreta striolata]|uniref:Iron-binding zinc finger CDGSH type domain-containing protein n=1 Tax=Phyllotreta striolata TaxID=444603 RepID=A0A9N9TSZ6_PHYSR|nr:unnamed protein product [Phyllotreta striolata]